MDQSRSATSIETLLPLSLMPFESSDIDEGTEKVSLLRVDLSDRLQLDRFVERLRSTSDLVRTHLGDAEFAHDSSNLDVTNTFSAVANNLMLKQHHGSVMPRIPANPFIEFAMHSIVMEGLFPLEFYKYTVEKMSMDVFLASQRDNLDILPLHYLGLVPFVTKEKDLIIPLPFDVDRG